MHPEPLSSDVITKWPLSPAGTVDVPGLLSPVVGHAIVWIPWVLGEVISAPCAIVGSVALINAAKSNVLLFNMMLSPFFVFFFVSDLFTLFSHGSTSSLLMRQGVCQKPQNLIGRVFAC